MFIPNVSPTPLHRVRPNLRFGLADGIGYSLMVGLGETYLAAFALALGFGEVFTGLLATLPVLAGACLQLISPAAVRRIGSRQRWVILCAVIQTSSFLPLLLTARLGHAGPLTLLLAAALYWGANFATGPAWTSWMESVVPPGIRATYFARRTGFTQLAALIGILGGGLVLQRGQSRSVVLDAFAVIFALAATSRVFSTFMLSRQTEPVRPCADTPEASIRTALASLRGHANAPFLLYLLLIQLTVSIAAPFFTPFMLRHLRLPYAEYTGLLAMAFLAKVVTLLLIGRVARRQHTLRLLRIGGIGIVPLSALWLVSHSLPYLLVIQVLSGCVWACYELGTFLLIFERIRIEERTALLTLYNLAHALMSVAGSLIGAQLFSLDGPLPAYVAIFAVSALGRALTLPLLARLGPLPEFRWETWLRPFAVGPLLGAISQPLLAGLFGRRAREPHAPPRRNPLAR